MDPIEKAKKWLSPLYDEETRSKVLCMINHDPKELEDAFYKDLEFGTGGLRGVMGVGSNRMNRYTVGMTTQGVANYVKMCFSSDLKPKVVISYDNRHCSKEFALVTAKVFAANGFDVFLFDNLRPTPELSFAIRELKCRCGVMMTASHNPKEYNGYKFYWEDGAQVVNPHDKRVIEEVNKITDISMVNFGSDDDMTNIHLIGEDMDNKYLSAILTLTLSPESVARHNDIKIVYSPLHGTGVNLVPMALNRMGLTKVYSVPDQSIVDGDFPTIASPNPEEASALYMAIESAKKRGADIVMATDPDADRVGIAVKNNEGEFVLLNGNQTASILTYYLLRRWSELGRLNENTYMVKTIVTTELLRAIAERYGVHMYNVLTGFKYIAEVVRENEGKKVFIGGGEESYGFNAGEFVRDKDAVLACCLIAECAMWALDLDMTLWNLLGEIYNEFGEYKESLISITMRGKEGAEQISSIMSGYRSDPPNEINGLRVAKVIDYKESEKTGLPKSNVLQFFTEDGSVISVRPSGTEPKIKFYFGVKGADIDKKLAGLERYFRNLLSN